MPVAAAEAAALCMSAMASESSDSDDVDDAVEEPVDDEMEERCADDDEGREALENTCKEDGGAFYLWPVYNKTQVRKCENGPNSCLSCLEQHSGKSARLCVQMVHHVRL